MFPPTTFIEVFGEIGEPKEELEKIMNYKNAVFWTFNRKYYQKKTGGGGRQVQASAVS